MFLGTSGSLPLVYFGMATRIMAEHQGAGEAVQALVLAADVDRAVAAIEVSHFDGRHDVELVGATGRSETSCRKRAGKYSPGWAGLSTRKNSSMFFSSWPVK